MKLSLSKVHLNCFKPLNSSAIKLKCLKCMSTSSKFVIHTINILKLLDLNITLLTGKIPIWDSTQPLKSVPIIEGGVPGNKEFGDLFEIEIIKAYKQPFH